MAITTQKPIFGISSAHFEGFLHGITVFVAFKWPKYTPLIHQKESKVKKNQPQTRLRPVELRRGRPHTDTHGHTKTQTLSFPDRKAIGGFTIAVIII